MSCIRMLLHVCVVHEAVELNLLYIVLHQLWMLYHETWLHIREGGREGGREREREIEREREKNNWREACWEPMSW